MAEEETVVAIDHSSRIVHAAARYCLPDLQTSWFALRTRRNHENIVAEGLTAKRIEAYVPFREERRRWAHRIKRLRVPLLNGYIFGYFEKERTLDALMTRGVIEILGSRHGPLAIPLNQIETLRHVERSRLQINAHPFLVEGKHVRVSNGPLMGLEGIIERRSKMDHFCVNLPLLGQHVSVELSGHDLELG